MYKIHVKSEERERRAALQKIIRPKTWAALLNIYIYIYVCVCMYVCMYVCMGFPTNHTRPFIKVIGVSIRGVHGLDLVGLNP